MPSAMYIASRIIRIRTGSSPVSLRNLSRNRRGFTPNCDEDGS